MREKLFTFLADLSFYRPALVLFLWLGAAAGSLYLASRLQMMTGRTDLLSPSNTQVRNYTDFTHEFGTANNIYFIIQSRSLKRAKECADVLAAEIGKHPKYIRDALYRFDPNVMERKLFLHLSPDEIEGVESYLRRNEEFLKNAVAADNLSGVFSVIGEHAETRARERFESPDAVSELGALAALLDTMNSYLWDKEHDGINFLPAVAAGSLPFGVSDDPDGYLVGKNGETVTLAARPNADKEDSLEFLKPMMEALLQARAAALRSFPDVSIGMTGLPTFAYGDLRVMQDEMPLLFLLALALNVLLFFLFFRHPLEIAFAGVSLLLALACTLGAAEIFIGHLNIMSSVFAITMVSLGIDFGIHFIARIHYELSQGNEYQDALRRTFLGVGPPVTTGALTTAGAFFVLAFTDFRGLAELGIIAGCGILLCLSAMLTALPSLVTLWNRFRPISADVRGGTQRSFKQFTGVLATTARKGAIPIVLLAAGLTLMLCYFAPQVSFDYNFLHIQPKTSTTADYEEILMDRTGLSPSFNVIMGEDLASLREKVVQLRRFPSVARVDSATDLLPNTGEDDIEIIRRVQSRLAVVEQGLRKNHAPEQLDVIAEQFQEMKKGLDNALGVKSLFKDKEVLRQLKQAKGAVETFLANYQLASRETASRNLQDFSRDFFSYIHSQLLLLNSSQQLEEVRPSDYPATINTRFIGRTGKYAAYVFPSQSVWNKDFLDLFNADTLQVAPNAAGTALFAQSILETAGRALRQSGALILVVIIALVLLDFRRPIPAILALLSVLLGLIWMLGIMRILGWQYNPIDIMAVPVMLGIGIDNGVHIVHRYLDGGHDVDVAITTSGRAILVSSLTTIAGFGCLLLSTHRGLISLAQLLVLGMTACLIAALVVLPAILHLLGGRE